jgi:hypothetical protein
MSTQRSSLTQRIFRFTVPGTAPPAHRRVMAAGLAAAALSLAAGVALAAIGRAAFTVPASFGEFAFGPYALVTVLGVAGATATWAALTRLSSRPAWLLTRLAALVTALFLIPDFLLLGTPGHPAGPVAILMLMHLAVAVVTYTALVTIAPVRRTHVTEKDLLFSERAVVHLARHARRRSGRGRANRGCPGQARRPRWRSGGTPAPPGPDRACGTPPAGRGGPGRGAGPPPGAEAGLPPTAPAAPGR